jgi:hypothetical protein
LLPFCADLEDSVRKFWEFENAVIEPSTCNQVLEAEEDFCENHFKQTCTTNAKGRFVIKLPLKFGEMNMENTQNLALKRFYNLERKLNRDPERREEYSRFINEYLKLQHMELVANIPDDHFSYLSHHAVITENSTTTRSRVRVVFDASARSSTGLSLNDNLLNGPVIQQDLFSILLRFRSFQYVLTGDIAKMYRQIVMHPADANYQLIFWRTRVAYCNGPNRFDKLRILILK